MESLQTLKVWKFEVWKFESFKFLESLKFWKIKSFRTTKVVSFVVPSKGGGNGIRLGEVIWGGIRPLADTPHLAASS